MIKEIYCKLPSAGGYKKDTIETDNLVEEILQRCRVCLGTRPGDILGDPLFGIDLEDFIFDMSVDTDEIKERIDNLLNNYAGAGYEDDYIIDTEVLFGHNTTDMSDYLLINIRLNGQRILGIVVT
jgi:hypothetical protein